MYTKYIHAFPTMFKMLNNYMKYDIPTYDIMNCGLKSCDQVMSCVSVSFYRVVGLFVPEKIVMFLDPCYVVMIISLKL